MIIELFGPPASGKTSFAQSVTEHLRKIGHTVEPIISNRPAEWNGLSGERAKSAAVPALVRRLTRPIMQAGTTMLASTRHDQHWGELVDLDPPVNVIWRLRLKRYLVLLSEAWARASRSNHVVLFDQGYVQFAGSMMVLGRKCRNDHLARQLLAAIPKADLLVAVNAPRHVLDERLKSRLRSQGLLERCLEFDLQTNLASIAAIAKLEEGLRQAGRPMVTISSVGQANVKAALTEVELHMLGIRNAVPADQVDNRNRVTLD